MMNHLLLWKESIGQDEMSYLSGLSRIVESPANPYEDRKTNDGVFSLDFRTHRNIQTNGEGDYRINKWTAEINAGRKPRCGRTGDMWDYTTTERQNTRITGMPALYGQGEMMRVILGRYY